MAVFLVLILILLNFPVFRLMPINVYGQNGILGGPAQPAQKQKVFETAAVLAAQPLLQDDFDSSANIPKSIQRDSMIALASLQQSPSLSSRPQPDNSPSPSVVGTTDANQSAKLPDLRDYFSMPTQGFDWGILHPENAVDIANACGTPVFSAAEGLVIDVSLDSWSGGYGHYVLLEHPNGTKTRYAHLDKILVSFGDYLKQRQMLGTMGQTGDASGCHLHFEVDGAKNPFAR